MSLATLLAAGVGAVVGAAAAGAATVAARRRGAPAVGIPWWLVIGFASVLALVGAAAAPLAVQAAGTLVFAGAVLAAAEVDRQMGSLPDRLLIVAAGAAVLARPSLEGWAAGTVLGAVVWGIRSVATLVTGRPGFGLGDVKLAAVTGLFLGWEAVGAWYIAVVVGGAVGLGALASGRVARGDRIAFGPFVVAGLALNEVVPWSAILGVR